MTRADVAIIGTHVAPAKGYGGVAESTANLAHMWAKQGRAFLLCASDGSTVGRVTPEAIGLNHEIEVTLYHTRSFRRWGFGLSALFFVPRACLRARTVYVSGIATWPTTLAALACVLFQRPFITATRGGLMPAHVSQIRRQKPHKWLYYLLLTLPTLRRARIIHVTSELEFDGVRALLPDARIEIVANGIDFSNWHPAPPNPHKNLTLCFIGRLEEEKGINRFLEIWLECRQPNERFVIAGSGSGPYADELRRLAFSADGAVELVGYVDQAEINRILSSSHFLVLPSGIEGGARENFGNAIAEALSVARPVLATRGLAWDAIESVGIGFLFDHTNHSIKRAIHRARQTTDEKYVSMCQMSRCYGKTHFDLAETAQHIWQLLMSVNPVRSD